MSTPGGALQLIGEFYSGSARSVPGAHCGRAMVAARTLLIEKLRCALYGRRSEHDEHLHGQPEFALDETTASTI